MIAQINDLLSRVFDLHRAEQERIRQEEKEGKCFNVFSTLCLCSDETRLHSRLLAALLNPKANHGLGNAFLESFLRAIGLPPDYISGCKEPIVERSIGRTADTSGGRIDIILEDGKQRRAIIIENKMRVTSPISYFGIVTMAKSSLENAISSWYILPCMVVSLLSVRWEEKSLK